MSLWKLKLHLNCRTGVWAMFELKLEKKKKGDLNYTFNDYLNISRSSSNISLKIQDSLSKIVNKPTFCQTLELLYYRWLNGPIVPKEILFWELKICKPEVFFFCEWKLKL